MLAASLVVGATAALGQTTAGSDEAYAFITREWVWSDGTSITTFTAFGPPEQVNALDPQDGLIDCQDCRLASSVQFGPVDQAALTEVAE